MVHDDVTYHFLSSITNNEKIRLRRINGALYTTIFEMSKLLTDNHKLYCTGQLRSPIYCTSIEDEIAKINQTGFVGVFYLMVEDFDSP